MRESFNDLVNLEIYPFSRNIKIGVKEDRYLKLVENQIQQFLLDNSFRQRPIIKVVPRNERKYSQSKVLLVFYVPNKHDKYKKKEEKFYNLLLEAQDREENNFQLSHKTDLEWKE